MNIQVFNIQDHTASRSKMSLNRIESVMSSMTSDVTDLMLFNSQRDFYCASSSLHYMKNVLGIPTESDLNTHKFGSIVSFRLNSDVAVTKINSIQPTIPEENGPLSCIDELLIYAGDKEFILSEKNRHKSFMNIEIERESFCSFKNEDRIKRDLVKPFESQCTCQIASQSCGMWQNTRTRSTRSYNSPAAEERKHSKLYYSAKPFNIQFLNCEPGKVYVKGLTIINSSSHSQTYFLHTFLQDQAPFKLKVVHPPKSHDNKIAPGLKFKVFITFECKNYENFYNVLEIKGNDLNPIAIHIIARHDIPILSDVPDPNILDKIVSQKSVVSCPSCLPNETTSHCLELFNNSRAVRFLILDKELASPNTIDALQMDNNKLITGAFSLSPAYFSTECDAIVKIEITFSPKKLGPYCKKLQILCDHISQGSLYLRGQAYLFNPNMIKPLHMNKIYCADFVDCMEAEYYIGMGRVYRGRKRLNTFAILNTSPCAFHFHWEIHRYPVPGFKVITPRMMTLIQKHGILLGEKEKKFRLTVDMGKSSEGEYRTLLCLYIDNLSEAKVDLPFVDKLIKRSNRKGLSLLVARIEVHVQCAFAKIEARPQVISLRRIPLLCGPENKFSTNIKVRNLSPHQVECFWGNLISDENKTVKFEMKPTSAKVPAKSKRLFRLSITGIKAGYFSQHIRCTANKNECIIFILVQGYVTLGFINVSDDFKTCGVIKRNKKLDTEVILENYSNLKWDRTLSEYRYHSSRHYTSRKDDITEMEETCPRRVLAMRYIKRGLYDKYKRLIPFLYRINTNIEENVIWCSLLKWKLGDATEYLGVIADIQWPLVTLTNSEIVNECLLHSSTSAIKLELVNHSPLTVFFEWCNPIGEQRHYFEFQFDPVRGILKRYETSQILLYLTPLAMITIEDLHFICIVKGMPKPLLMTVTGSVQPLIIVFEWWQNNEDEDEKSVAVWQSIEESSSRMETPNEEPLAQVSSSDKKLPSIESPLASVISTINSDKIGSFVDNRAPVQSESDNSRGSISFTEHSSTDTSNNNSNRSFLGKIKIDVNSCNTAFKKSLQMKNSTKAIVPYSTSILHFHPVEDKPVFKKCPQKSDYLKWKSLIQPGLGIAIWIEEPSGQLSSHEKKELCIWVFATSWGVYHDVLIIDGNSYLPAVNFELEIVCSTCPIRFPALITPVLRLDSINYLDEVQSHPIRVENNSSTNILIHWSIHNFARYKANKRNWPFKLDLWDPSPETNQLGLTLIPYYGPTYLDTFSVDEPYFSLEPWSKRILTLNFNPSDLILENIIMPHSLEAVLVGSIFKDPGIGEPHPNWNQSRMVAVENANLLIKLKLDSPNLKLLYETEENLQFIIRGEDIWNTRIYKQTKTLTWQNQSSVSTSVLFEVDEPLSIAISEQKGKKRKQLERVNLIKGEAFDMKLELEILNGDKQVEDLVQSFPIVQPATQAETLVGPRVIDRERVTMKQMKIIIDNRIEQIYDIRLIITLPKFNLSKRKIFFDPVFLETTKCASFDIWSEDSCPINFQIVHAYGAEVFCCYPTTGVVASRKAPVIIWVYFTPKLASHYRGKFIVKTSIPDHELTISVAGNGTFNSKHMGNAFLPK